MALGVGNRTLYFLKFHTELSGDFTHIGRAQVAVPDSGDNGRDGAHRQHTPL